MLSSINDEASPNWIPKNELQNLMQWKFNQWDLDEMIVEDFDGSEYYLKSFYNCRRILGVGGFAFVAEAFDEKTNEYFALKVMEKQTSQEEALDCIRNEAHILKQINSDKVTKFWFLREFKSHIVLGMELCKGGSLRDVMKWRKAKGLEFSDDECATIITAILRSIKEIHLLDIIHRDLKPANFLFKDWKDLNSIRIADFGLAKKLSMNVNQIQTGSGGTLLY